MLYIVLNVVSMIVFIFVKNIDIAIRFLQILYVDSTGASRWVCVSA